MVSPARLFCIAASRSLPSTLWLRVFINRICCARIERTRRRPRDDERARRPFKLYAQQPGLCARKRFGFAACLLLRSHSVGGYCTVHATCLSVLSIVGCLSHVGCAALRGVSQCLQGRVRSRPPHLPLSLAAITHWAHRAPWARSSAPPPPLMLADVGRRAPWSAWRGRRACCCWWRRSTPSSP